MKNEKGSYIRGKCLKGIALVIVFLILSGFFPGMGASFVQGVEAAENTNVTQGKTATASSYMLPYRPQRAVDGNYSPTSRWVVASNSDISGNWLMVDLGGYYTCNRWTVEGIEGNWSLESNGYKYGLSNYVLQRCITVDKWNDENYWGYVDSGSGTVTKDISRFTARYVRLRIGNGNLTDEKLAAVQEFAVYGYATTQPVITNDIPPVYAADGSKVTIQSVIADDGGDNVTEKGIVYSTSNNPEIDGSSVTKIISDDVKNSYSIDLTGLDPHTTYYVRAYAKNIMGTGYGENIKLNISRAVDVALTGSVASTVYGQAVTYTATLSVPVPSENPSTPTGYVDFKNGDTILDTVAISGNKAEITYSSLASGSHNITAVYKGDTNCDSNYSAIWAHAVAKANTSAVVTSSANPSVYKQGVTYTATVSALAPGGGVPTGSVTFRDAGSLLEMVSLTGGVASCTVSAPAVGSHSITADYYEDANYKTAPQASLTQVVDKSNTVTVLSADMSTSVYGQTVTYSATVSASSPGSGIPSGTITFKDGAVSLGTVSLSGGTATFSTSVLATGSHNITAVYNGDGNYNSSTASALTQTISKSDTEVLLSSSLNPSDLGQLVTYTATVGASFPGGGTPTGTVTFYDGGVSLCAPVTLTGGIATFATSPTTARSHSIVAVYGGDVNYNGKASSELIQTVNKLNTVTSLSGDPNPATYGHEVTYTATVTGGATGTVTFKDGPATLGTATLSAEGTATFATSTLIGGSHSLTAIYEGDSSYNSSTSTALTQVVNTAASTTTLSSSLNPSTFGQSVVYAATVTAGATGTVTFKDGTYLIGTATLSGEGTATLSIVALQSGSHNIYAVYNGDTNYSGSTSAGITQVVNAVNPTIGLSGNPNPSAYGQAVTFYAALPSGASGTVTFKDGSEALGTSTLDGAGIAAFTTSSMAVAQHSITAVYGGDSNYNSVISSELKQVVNAAASTTILGVSPAPSTYGQSVTFTATVTAGATGTVTFKDGSAILGTGVLSGTTAAFSTTALTGGSHSITAVYGGDSNYGASTSSISTQVVNTAATTTILWGSPAPSTYGQSVTFTATVTAGATGTVTFKEGSAILGTGVLSGTTATFTTSALTGGSHSITALYEGDSNYGASTSSALMQEVNAATTSTTLSCTPNPSAYGQTVTITAMLPFDATGTVDFMDGAATLGTATVAGGSATFTTASMAKGDHSIIAVYGGDANYIGSTSSALTQVVNAVTTTVSLGCSPTSSTYGQLVTLTATVNSGATGTVSFKEGTTILGTSTVSGSETATLTITELNVGNHTFEALYSGDANFAPASSDACTHIVAASAAAITVKSSLPASIKGQEVTFTAEVIASAPGSGTPTGTVTFMDGEAPLATAALSGGIATYTTASLEAATHNITAVYGGDGNFGSCISAQYSYIVGENAVGKAAADKAVLTIGFASGDDLNSVKSNISLADEGAIYKSLITWESSNDDVIKIIDYTGYVNRPSYGGGNAYVTVTASVYNEGVKDTKDFDLTVFELPKAEATSTEKVVADKASLAISYTPGEDEGSVKGNISLPAVGPVYGSTITWISSDSSVIDIEAGSEKFLGEVTRPVFASGNADVTVTAYVYNDGASDEKDFRLTVLKLPRTGEDGDKPRDRGNSNKPAITITTTTVNVGTVAEVTVTTATTVSEARIDKAGSASATITPVQVSEAIDRAIEAAALQAGGAAAAAEIKIIAPGDVKSVEAIIPGNSINTTAESNISAFMVSTPVASVSFDQKSLDTISQEAGGNVNINISKLDKETLPEEVQKAVGDRLVFDFSVTSGSKAITQFGGSVTVSIPYEPKAGEDDNAIVIYYINSDGKLETVRDCVYDRTSGTIRFNTSHFSRYAIGYNKVNFTDVPENAWYQAAVTFTSSRGISNGTGGGKYGPQERLTRGQFIVMAMRAFGIEPDEDPSINFIDAGNTYYTGYLAAAKRLSLTKGTGENRYSPDKEISRQEMFALLYSILESEDKLPADGNGSKLTAYADSDRIAAWAKDAMSLFVGTGTIKGSNGSLAPVALISRAEMAQVLYNLISEY